MGDFNGHLKLDNSGLPVGDNSNGNLLAALAGETGLVVINESVEGGFSPTLFDSGTQSVLDYVLAEPELAGDGVAVVEGELTLASDHLLVHGSIQVPLAKRPSPPKKRVWNLSKLVPTYARSWCAEKHMFVTVVQPSQLDLPCI